MRIVVGLIYIRGVHISINLRLAVGAVTFSSQPSGWETTGAGGVEGRGDRAR